MEKLELKDNWSMRRAGEENWREARVWGSVYTDLLRNGEIPDPYWKDNEDQICALMEADYEYQCRFTAEDPKAYARVFLSFEGLDTVADIWLNGTYLGHAENMHRTWDYEVKEYLKKDNVLQVISRSPLKFIAQAYEKYKNIGNEDTYEGFMHLRKAHYMFGWDWGAHLPDAGIFRPVYLCYVKNASLEDVYIRQRQEKNDWLLDFQIQWKEERKGDYQIQVSAVSPQGEVFKTRLSLDGSGTLRIPDPQLWWVNGLGDQPLYQVRAVLYRNGEPEDCWERRIGLRKMTVRREKDQWGESFAHEINGIPFFAMGADYIPEEHLLGNRSREKTRQLLEDCKRANFNVIRVWGGGFYPDDWFYDYVVGSIQYGWIKGLPDGTFGPNNTITRAEVTTIVNRMLDRSADEDYVDSHTASLRQFTDLADTHWAYYDIMEATNTHDYTKDTDGETWADLG